ncbi:MAG: universal stress protein [Deltaproteobacteria bacterium]|nr:universal stress protein [Deltaproteobacteria bacterium]
MNLLVAVDTSLEASIALRTACSLSSKVSIQPIYVYDPPGRDIEVGAGWARHSWEKETSHQARANIENLVLAERNQCPDINDPVVLKGDPAAKITAYFRQNHFDLLVVGAPFRSMKTVGLSRCFRNAVQKSKKGLPLLIVRHLKNIQRVVALTDGGDSAERALGLLLRFIPFLTVKITLVGLARAGDKSHKIQVLNLERGRAILKEKDMEACGHTISELGFKGIKKKLKDTDLLICPVLPHDGHNYLKELEINKLQAALFYIGQE